MTSEQASGWVVDLAYAVRQLRRWGGTVDGVERCCDALERVDHPIAVKAGLRASGGRTGEAIDLLVGLLADCQEMVNAAADYAALCQRQDSVWLAGCLMNPTANMRSEHLAIIRQVLAERGVV